MTDQDSPSARIEAKLAALGDWRGQMLALVRRLIHEADPDVIETVKWAKPANPAGVPCWELAGIICTGEVYKDYAKLPALLQLRYGSAGDAIQVLGSVKDIRNTFTGFQATLYHRDGERA